MVMIFAMSCRQDFETEALSQEPDIQVVGDAVHFKNNASFSITMKGLHEMGIDKLPEFEKTIGFNNSLRKYLANEKQVEQPDLNINIKDFFLATVVNERGIYYIGRTIYKIGSDFEFALNGGDEIELNNRVSVHDGSEISGEFQAFRIKEWTKQFEIAEGRFSGLAAQTYGIGTDESGNEKRIEMEAWSRNYLLYASNGVNLSSESYRRTCGFCSKKWAGSAVQFLRVEVESRQYSSITGSGAWFVLNKTKEGYSTDYIQQVMDYVAGTGVWIDTDYIKCNYIGIGGSTVLPVDYTQRSIFIEWRN